MPSPFSHHPVLLSETLSLLELRADFVVVDGTVGGAGHAAAILERTGPGGQLIALDVDGAALAAAGHRLRSFGDRVRLVRASFRDLESVLAELGIPSVDGVLLDLGVSSPQLDEPQRGFRFAEASADATPLDMRMDDRAPITAATLLRDSNAAELREIFRTYGELPGSARLARGIVDARRGSPLRTAGDLLRVIDVTGVGRGRRHHPATLVFQALRMAVNDEVRALEEGIEAGIEALRPGRRIAILAYHSIEDRIVKNRFRDAARGCVCPPRTPVCICGGRVRLRLVTKRPVRPDPDETRGNPRARSARLRAAERVAEAA